MTWDQSTHTGPDLTPEPQRSLRTDGCPECVQRGNYPIWTRDDGTGAAFFAWYHCACCGHWWTTAWADEADR